MTNLERFLLVLQVEKLVEPWSVIKTSCSQIQLNAFVPWQQVESLFLSHEAQLIFTV